MVARGITLPVEVEGSQQAERELKDVAGAVDQTTDSTKKAAGATRDQSRAAADSAKTNQSLADRFSGLADQITPLTLGLGGVTAVLAEIASTAREAAAAIAEVGEQSAGLSGNIGGGRVDTLLPQINEIALNLGLDAAGRNQLIQGATTFTDLNPDASNAEILAATRSAGQLSVGADTSGADAVKTIDAISKALGVDQAQATDIGSVFLTRGFGADQVQQLAQRTGSIGGRDFLAATLGGAQFGLNTDEAPEQVLQLVNALDRRNAEGELDESLRNLGIESGDSLNQRVRRLTQLRQRGELDQGELAALLGGPERLAVFNPLSQAITTPGVLRDARGALNDPQAIESAIENRRQSEFFLALQRANRRDLRTRLAQENAALSVGGEALAEGETFLAEQGAGSRLLGAGNVGSQPTSSGFSLGFGAAAQFGAGLFADQQSRVTIINNNPIIGAEDARSIDPTGEGD